MKKIITLASATILTAVAMTAIDWGQVTNLAINSTVTVSSNPDASATITDDDNGSSWQAIAGVNSKANDWAIIDLGEAKTFNEIEIIWEASHPTVYSIYTSTEPIPHAETTVNIGTDEAPNNISCNKIDSDWLDSASPIATGGEVSEAGFTDNITLAESVTSRYILIYATEYNNWASQYGSRIWEVRVANIEGRDDVSSLTVTDAIITEGETAEITVTPVNVTGNPFDITAIENLTLTCSEPDAVEITAKDGGKFDVKGLRLGSYTLTATATANGKTVSGTATFTVEYNWANAENVALNKTATGRILNPSDEYTFLPKNVTDGDEDTYYTYDGEWGGGDAWVIVDLGQEYMINAVGISYGDLSGGTYKYSFGAEDAAQPTESDFKWIDDNALEGWTSTSTLDRKSNSVNNYIPETAVKARYVAVRDASNPNGKPQIKEIYVAGEAYTSSVATSIDISSDINYIATGETVTISCEVLDQYGVKMEGVECDIKADEVTLENNKYTPSTTGAKNIVATYGDLENSLSLYVVAHQSEIVATPEITFNDEESVTKNGNEIHWSAMNVPVVLTFDKAYDFTLIKLSWETACASDYTVTATDAAGNQSTILEVTDRPYSGHGEVDRIYYAAPQSDNLHRANASSDLTAIKSLTILPTAIKHNTAWTTKLLSVETYGTANTAAGVEDVIAGEVNTDKPVNVYNLSGILVRSNVERAEALNNLPAGIYIVDGKKVVKN